MTGKEGRRKTNREKKNHGTKENEIIQQDKKEKKTKETKSNRK